MDELDGFLCYEHCGIGIENESNLHKNIKQWIAKPGDRFEVKVDGNVVDIVRDNTLIEIQTKNFTAMRKKLLKLLNNYEVVIVHPIAEEKWILTTNKDGELIRKRKSTRKGKLVDLFNELVSIPELVNHRNFRLMILITNEEELRCDDGRGSWRRKGVSIMNRSLVDVKQVHCFESRADFKRFLPFEQEFEFTNKDLAEALSIKATEAQRITYCLKKIGMIAECGKRGRSLLYKPEKSEEIEWISKSINMK